MMRRMHVATLALLLGGAAFLFSAPRAGAADNPAAKGEHGGGLSAFAVARDKTQHVFYRNGDGEIIELYTREGDPTGWHASNPTAEAVAPKAASSPDAYYWDETRTQHVFFRGTDDVIHELYTGANGKWTHNALFEKGQTPKAAGTPAAYAEEGNKTQHVIYRTGEGAVIEMYSKQGDTAGWRSRDLTVEAKAPKAAGDPDAFYWRDTRSQHVIYRDADDALQELYMDPQGQWQHNDLTKAADAPRAAGTPAALGEEGNKTEHVYYRTREGEVIELYAQYGQPHGWKMNDLTKAAGAPKAVGSPTGYRVKESSLRGIVTQHVIYRGSEGSLHEVYLGPDSRWAHTELTKAASAPRAESNPAGYVNEADRTQHVVYRTTDDKIYELYNVPDGPNKGWHANDLTAAAKVKTP